jgi:hypothetical protein
MCDQNSINGTTIIRNKPCNLIEAILMGSGLTAWVICVLGLLSVPIYLALKTN